jgi:hypothetical protein
MKRRITKASWGLGLWIGLGLMACAGKGEPEPTVEEFLADDPGAVEIAREGGAPKLQVRTDSLPGANDERWTSVHYNLTIQVDAPKAAVDRARAVLMEAGAEIQNLNRQDDNANLNAVADAKAYAKVLRAVEDLGGSVQYENSSRNEMGPQIRQLRERLDLARQADAVLTEQSAEVHGERLDALMFLRELNQRERQNLENQIRSYWDQAGKTYVYLTFQRKA